jgi:type IV pilus assembly protein PilE
MKTKQTGFTLVELMITVAIIGILTSVGYPSYQNHIKKAKRVEAQGALVSFATAMEQWRVENNSYKVGTDGTVISDIFSNQVPTDGGTKTYTLSLVSDATSYTLTATPDGTQVSDECGTLTLNNAGEKGATKSGAAVANCWD